MAAPPPNLTISQWADRYRKLSSESASEPGQWHTDRAEYQREIMDAVSDASVETVVIKSSTQVGKSEIGLNMVGYHIDQDPAPMMVILPTERDAESWSKDRFAPMVRDMSCLRGKLSGPKSRDGSNKILHKKFTGGQLTLVGSNAPSGLAMRPIRILLCDEVDRYPASAGAEGDPVNLAKKRTVTFWNRKIILVSTPTIKGVSRIDAAWENSDKRRYWVPCPECGEFQLLHWEQVRWNKEEKSKGKTAKHLPETAHYVCEHCGDIWNDSRRWSTIRLGEWRAEKPFVDSAGFHLNEIYSPWKKLDELVREFLFAKEMGEEGMKVFVNTSLGEVFEIRGEAPEWERIYNRREDYAIGIVPNGGLFLTAGADVQRDRIEVEVVAWGRDRESWSVDYRVLLGDTAKADVWNKLSAMLEERFPHAATGADMIIERMAVDSGYATQEVYAWSRTAPLGRVMPIKGVDKSRFPIQGPSDVEVKIGKRKRKRGAKLWTVCGPVFKAELYGNLRHETPETGDGDAGFPPGYCHFPQYDPEYFKQLTAEQAVTRAKKNGFAVIEWQKTRERNEALDCRVYARAAAEHDLIRLTERVARNKERKLEENSKEVAVKTISTPSSSSGKPDTVSRWAEPVLSDDPWL